MIGSVILIALNILGTLWLESTLTRYYRFEFAVVTLLFLFGLLIILAEMKEKRWAWSWQTVYFALSILNLAFLFMIVDQFLAFALTCLVSLVGLLRAVSRLDDPESMDPEPTPVTLETYDAKRNDEPLYVEPVMWVHPDDLVSEVSQVRTTTKRSTKKSTRKKSTKKKSSRKKATKRKTSKRKTSKKKSKRKKVAKKARKKSRRR